MNRNVVSIGGLDPSGCAGILADMKTFNAWRVYGLAVITAVTAQNTMQVDSVYPVPLEVIGSQLESILSDIEIHAVKIGMMATAPTIELVAELCKTFQLPHIVVDPVLRSSTGYQFADDKMLAVYKTKLFPLADLVTPNLQEASVFAEMDVTDVLSMKAAAEKIHGYGCKNVIVKGGHLEQRAIDVLYDGIRHSIYDAPRIVSTNTRGIGCTFASIMALHMAKKSRLEDAINPAKKYLARAMVHPFKIGKGDGPLNHHATI